MTQHFLLQFALCLLVAQEKGQRQDRAGARSGPSSRNRRRSISIGIKRWMLAGFCWLHHSNVIVDAAKGGGGSEHVLPDMPFPAWYKYAPPLASIQNRPWLQQVNQALGSAAPCELQIKKQKKTEIVM
jgi:hypothetical protein